MKIPLPRQLISDILSLLYLPLGYSYRFVIHNRELEGELKGAGKPLIYAFWHNRLVPLVAYYARFYRKSYPNKKADILVSQSKDGEIAARILERFHFGTIRGSSTRGGREAFLELVARIRSGVDSGIIPDGPKGPRYQAKEGAVALARLTGAVVLPLGVSAKPVKVFSSWDRLMLPLPFAKIVVLYGDPICVEKGGDLEEARTRLENALMAITKEADRRIGLQVEY